MKRAIIFGATGLIGSALLEIILRESYYNRVICFTRQRFVFEHPNFQNIVTDFSDLDNYPGTFHDADVFCCLGTTIKSAQYDKEKFKEADLYRPLMIAELCIEHGASQFIVISAMSANKNSLIFYNRVKAELEERLKTMHLESLHIIHPSLLLGPRKEFRLGERIGQLFSILLSPFMAGDLRDYRPIQSSIVAKAMTIIARQNLHGKFTYSSGELQQIAHAG